MKRRCYKILFALATIGFVLTAMNVTLTLHLASHDENHDREKCPICQQAVMNKKIAILYPDVNVYQDKEREYTAFYRVFLPPQIIEYKLPQLRAPPFFS